MVIIALSVVMLLIGAMMFIRPRGDSAPEPWEMGALEVELEEQMEREAAGLTDDEDFGVDDLEIDGGLVANARRKEGDTSEENKSDYTENMASAGVPVEDDLGPIPSADNGVMDELLGDDDEDLDLGDLDDMADDLNFDEFDEEESEDDDIDTSFLDEML